MAGFSNSGGSSSCLEEAEEKEVAVVPTAAPVVEPASKRAVPHPKAPSPLVAGLKEAVEKVVPAVPSAAPVVEGTSKRAIPDPEAPSKAGKVMPWPSLCTA